MGAGASAAHHNAAGKQGAWAVTDNSIAGDTFVFAVKQHVQCTFEGLGSLHGCRHEDYRRQGGKGAINGLHSDWITDDVLAMARPSDRLLLEYDIVGQFKKAGIAGVINLQEVGEHAGCGDGVLPGSGFSYTPEKFMAHGIFHYNFSWRDMGCPALDYTLNIVQVVAFTIDAGRKIAIHCHAGLGRTGLVIACYLVFADRFTPTEAVAEVRRRRPGSLQTRAQVEHVTKFAQYLASLKTVFPPINQHKHPATSLVTLIANQRRLLHGEIGVRMRYVPRLVDEVSRELRDRVKTEEGWRSAVDILLGAEGSGLQGRLQGEDQRQMEVIKQQVNGGKWGGLARLGAAALAQLLLDWLRTLEECMIPTDVLHTTMAAKTASEAAVRLQAAGKVVFRTLRTLSQLMLNLARGDRTLQGRLGQRLAWEVLRPVPPAMSGDRSSLDPLQWSPQLGSILLATLEVEQPFSPVAASSFEAAHLTPFLQGPFSTGSSERHLEEAPNTADLATESGVYSRESPADVASSGTHHRVDLSGGTSTRFGLGASTEAGGSGWVNEDRGHESHVGRKASGDNTVVSKGRIVNEENRDSRSSERMSFSQGTEVFTKVYVGSAALPSMRPH